MQRLGLGGKIHATDGEECRFVLTLRLGLFAVSARVSDARLETKLAVSDRAVAVRSAGAIGNFGGLSLPLPLLLALLWLSPPPLSPLAWPLRAVRCAFTLAVTLASGVGVTLFGDLPICSGLPAPDRLLVRGVAGCGPLPGRRICSWADAGVRGVSAGGGVQSLGRRKPALAALPSADKSRCEAVGGRSRSFVREYVKGQITALTQRVGCTTHAE